MTPLTPSVVTCFFSWICKSDVSDVRELHLMNNNQIDTFIHVFLYAVFDKVPTANIYSFLTSCPLLEVSGTKKHFMAILTSMGRNNVT